MLPDRLQKQLKLEEVNISNWRKQWHPTPVLLPGKSHGRRSLLGCSLWGQSKLDTTERLHFHFSLACTGEGNGTPLQCSWLENPRDGGAWWAAIYGVAQSWTWLKWLSSSSSNILNEGGKQVKRRKCLTSTCSSPIGNHPFSALLDPDYP